MQEKPWIFVWGVGVGMKTGKTLSRKRAGNAFSRRLRNAKSKNNRWAASLHSLGGLQPLPPPPPAELPRPLARPRTRHFVACAAARRKGLENYFLRIFHGSVKSCARAWSGEGRMIFFTWDSIRVVHKT